ncbi:hypothetical protein [Peptoniphilus porci]|uniref:hypothetical protein n=1 Tax=Peptoniphilus porci TaxID=2652280 RepID=UPI001F25A7AC|nr:hypothetical protein [Peptoniphilus porci]
MKNLAVFDTGPGIVGLYQEHRDFLNYYIDDKFEYYGLYKRDAVNERIEYIKKFFKKDKKVYVMDFDAINYFKDFKNAEFGEKSLKNKLAHRKILCLSSKLTLEEKTLDNFTKSYVKYFNAPLLINACNDTIADEIIKKICDEYFQDFDFNGYDLIFLASSGLHLKKDFFKKYFKGIEIFSNTDALLEDYKYKKENYIRDYFYVTNSKRGFYSRSEKYLREKGVLKDKEILNVSKLKKKKVLNKWD